MATSAFGTTVLSPGEVFPKRRGKPLHLPFLSAPLSKILHSVREVLQNFTVHPVFFTTPPARRHKDAPRCTKTRQRSPQDVPKTPQDVPKTAQDRSKIHQNVAKTPPTWPQDPPTPPRTSRTASKASPTPQDASQIDPKTQKSNEEN